MIFFKCLFIGVILFMFKYYEFYHSFTVLDYQDRVNIFHQLFWEKAPVSAKMYLYEFCDLFSSPFV